MAITRLARHAGAIVKQDLSDMANTRSVDRFRVADKPPEGQVMLRVGETLFQALIVLIANRLQPNGLSLLSWCNRYICKAAFRRCTVPMFHAGSAFDYISLVNDSD